MIPHPNHTGGRALVGPGPRVDCVEIRLRSLEDERSSLGCFVLCSGEVEKGENVKLFFPLAEGMKVQFWGEIVNHVFEIGFGVKFIEVNAAQREFLEEMVASK